MGFGFFDTYHDVESYFIFSDGSKSEIKTTTELNKFTETSFPVETKISRLLINHKSKSSKYPGLLMGIEIFDDKNVSILKAGDFTQDQYTKLTEIKIEAGERLIGVKSGRRGETTNKHFDVQFIVGKKVQE